MTPRSAEAPERPGRRGKRHHPAKPPGFVPLAALTGLFLVLPLAGLLVQAPWASIPRRLAEPEVAPAVGLSALVATAATVIAVALGVPLAWVLARRTSRWVILVRGLVLVPLLLPPLVSGVGLLAALGRRGLVGRYLYTLTGRSLPFTTPAAVVAVSFVALPFVVMTVEGGLRSIDHRLESAAASLGAPPGRVFRTVTLPLIAPSLAAAAALAWARSIGEFGATLTFAGNLAGRTQTLPLATFLALETDLHQAVLLSLLLLLPTFGVLGILHRSPRSPW